MLLTLRSFVRLGPQIRRSPPPHAYIAPAYVLAHIHASFGGMYVRSTYVCTYVRPQPLPRLASSPLRSTSFTSAAPHRLRHFVPRRCIAHPRMFIFVPLRSDIASAPPRFRPPHCRSLGFTSFTSLRIGPMSLGFPSLMGTIAQLTLLPSHVGQAFGRHPLIPT